MNKYIQRFLAVIALAGMPVQALEADAIKLWQDDLAEYKAGLMQNHINLFHSISPAEFDQALTQLKADLPQLQHWQVITRLMQLTRRIGDGHTTIPLWQQQKKRFPISFTATSDAYVVSAVGESQSHLLGLELVSINGLSAGKVITRLASVVPFVENSFSERVRVAEALNLAPLLHAMGVTELADKSLFELRKHSGETISVEFEAKTAAQISDIKWQHLSAVNPADFFVALPELASISGVWAGYSKQHSAGYLAIDSYPDMAAAMQIGQSLVEHMSKEQATHLIIDLRNSYGGDLYIGLLLASYISAIDSLDWQNGVQVLISNKTFSAAMANATQFRRLLNAKLVGQPTGAKPNGYQDMGQFVLPNSKLMITFSKKYFRFSDRDEDAVKPDVEIALTTADLRRNHDKVLTTVLKNIATAQAKLTPEQKNQLLGSLINEIEQRYVLTHQIDSIRPALIELNKSETFKRISSPAELANFITEKLRVFDEHFTLQYQPSDNISNSAPAKENWFARLSRQNYGFSKVEILTGNIGYVDFWGFAEVNGRAKQKVDSVMQFLSDTDAIIIDLRRNGGGSAEMVQLISSYFLPGKTHLNSFYHRPTDNTTEFWTLDGIPQLFSSNSPVYILIGEQTFSAAEEFAYNFQHLKRGTIVGDKSRGGANPWTWVPLNDGFRAGIPVSMAINPITKTNWEGKGVQPDVAVNANEAFNTAYKMALKHIQSSTPKGVVAEEIAQQLIKISAD